MVTTKAGYKKDIPHVASGAKTNRAQLGRLFDQFEIDDVLVVAWLDRFGRSTYELLNTLAAITSRLAD